MNKGQVNYLHIERKLLIVSFDMTTKALKMTSVRKIKIEQLMMPENQLSLFFYILELLASLYQRGRKKHPQPYHKQVMQRK